MLKAIYIHPDTHAELKELAASRGKSLKTISDEAINFYIAHAPEEQEQDEKVNKEVEMTLKRFVDLYSIKNK